MFCAQLYVSFNKILPLDNTKKTSFLLFLFSLNRIFAVMEKETKKNAASKHEDDMMREKASGYLVCFIDGCPLHETCMRWVVGCYANQDQVSHVSVNPRNPRMGGEDCPMFREKVRVKVKRGLTRFYHEMPGYMEQAIRRQLIAHFGRKHYFLMRRGDKFIYPADQQAIERICRLQGWTAPLVYDGEDEDWLW